MTPKERNQDKGTLYVVGTPIGNLEDISLRALRILAEVHVIASEDTRVTTKLCRRHNIETPLTSFREQNAKVAIPKLLNRLESGQHVALVTDAGTPSVSDPGVDLVAAAQKAHILVTPIPGPSALATAISVAGLLGDGIHFVGFLPRSGRRRKEGIQTIRVDPALTVIYESPRRIGKTLADLADACDSRQAVLLRELTKLHEEIARGTISELRDRFSGEVKGEITLVIEGSKTFAQEELTEDRLREIIRIELAKGLSVKDVANALSRGLGLPRKRIYDLAVTLTVA